MIWNVLSGQNIKTDKENYYEKNFQATGVFTVSMADAAHVVECDYVGVVSANDVPDKVAKAGFHVTKSEFVNAPLFDELPMALECKVISYDEESCRLVGEIVNVSADERVLGEKVGDAFKDGLELK